MKSLGFSGLSSTQAELTRLAIRNTSPVPSALPQPHRSSRTFKEHSGCRAQRFLEPFVVVPFVALTCRLTARRKAARLPKVHRRNSFKDAVTGDGTDSYKLISFLSSLRAGELDTAIEGLEQRKRELKWARLPSRIVMLRHGESEGNVDQSVYSVKGDGHLDLTCRGLRQARDAGARLQALVGKDRMCAFVSPFERAQQTLLGLYEGGFPEEQVHMLRIDPRIREKEFGNFQSAGTMATKAAEEQIVGRFYYRLPNAESCADVFDRVANFVDCYLSKNSALQGFDTCLLVTHGLTIRLLLMEMLHWTVNTFESVHNLGNCDYVVLTKNMENLCYELCPEQSYPPRALWSTKKIWIRLHSLRPSKETQRQLQDFQCLSDDARKQPDIARAISRLEAKWTRECSKPYTVIDYMSLPKPMGPTKTTTMALETVLRHCIEGHKLGNFGHATLRVRAGQTGLKPSDVHSIDWWGDGLSYRGKQLRMPLDTTGFL